MHVLEEFFLKTVKYRLINKFLYSDSAKLPQFEKMTLNFRCNPVEMKELSTSLLASELITNQKGIAVKMKGGCFIGCKVTLRKKKMYLMLDKLLTKTFPTINHWSLSPQTDKQTKFNSFSCSIKAVTNFDALKKYEYLLNFSPTLRVSITTNSNDLKDSRFLMSFAERFHISQNVVTGY